MPLAPELLSVEVIPEPEAICLQIAALAVILVIFLGRLIDRRIARRGRR